MASVNARENERSSRTNHPVVDPRAPRFGQSLTASGLLVGIVFDIPLLVFAVATVLVLAVASQWRIQLYGLLFRTVVKPRLSPAEPESATPHRFATLVGAVGTTLASAAILAGFPLVGYVVAVPIVIAAGLGATTGFCLGCHMYQQVATFQRLSVL